MVVARIELNLVDPVGSIIVKFDGDERGQTILKPLGRSIVIKCLIGRFKLHIVVGGRGECEAVDAIHTLRGVQSAIAIKVEGETERLAALVDFNGDQIRSWNEMIAWNTDAMIVIATVGILCQAGGIHCLAREILSVDFLLVDVKDDSVLEEDRQLQQRVVGRIINNDPLSEEV